MQFRLDHVDPNPFRRMDRYPIQQEKVEALERSIKSTGFWDNVVARLAPGAPGRAQIAYGHHRLVTLRRVWGPEHPVQLIVRELSDADMLRIMAQENMAEWDSNALIDQETVQAVVDAVAEGTIELPEPSDRAPMAGVRYAPSYVLGDVRIGRSEHPYTAATVAEFLSWPVPKVKITLGALELIQREVLQPRDFLGLSATQARQLVQQARALRDEHAGVGSQKLPPSAAVDPEPERGAPGAVDPPDRGQADQADPDPGRQQPQPDTSLAQRVDRVLDPEHSELGRELRALVGGPPALARAAAVALEALAVRTRDLAAQLRRGGASGPGGPSPRGRRPGEAPGAGGRGRGPSGPRRG